VKKRLCRRAYLAVSGSKISPDKRLSGNDLNPILTEWGSVIAIEAQERIYYALAGNIAINNGFNAIAMHAAVSSEPGIMQIPTPDYFLPSSFGNLELKPRVDTEFIAQPIDYSPARLSQSRRFDRCARFAAGRHDQARYPGHGAGGA
jgi:hypothetical protein